MVRLWCKLVAVGFTISLCLLQIANMISLEPIHVKIAGTGLIVFLETLVMAGYASLDGVN